MFDAVPSLLSQLQAGKLRPLAAASSIRNSLLPNVPTFDEVGIKGMEASIWYGIVGPAGLPQPIVQKLNAALLKCGDAGRAAAFAKQGALPCMARRRTLRPSCATTPRAGARVVRKNNIKLEQ